MSDLTFLYGPILVFAVIAAYAGALDLLKKPRRRVVRRGAHQSRAQR
jgi:hypothetical protein